MPPFRKPQRILHGIKERIEALHSEGDRVYLGTALGNLSIYDISRDDNCNVEAKLISTKSLGKKAVEQLGFVKDISSLVALSDSVVTLYPIPELVPPTPLLPTRKAFSFAINSTVERVATDGAVQSFNDVTSDQTPSLPTAVTYLVVGSQRKLVIYCWRDGEAEPVKEVPLPHSARVISFVKSNVLCLAYSATEHVFFYLETMSTGEVTMPVSIPSAASAGAYGMNALSGLGGYMSLGLAAKAKTMALSVQGRALIPRDNTGLFFEPDGKAAEDALVWSAPPEEIAYAKPYVVSVQPAGTVAESAFPDSSTPPLVTNGTVQAPTMSIQSALSYKPLQSLVLPIDSTHTLRHLCSSPGSKAPLLISSTPADRTTATTHGASVWMIEMRSWSEQLDELVEEELYFDALILLESLDTMAVPDQLSRRTRILSLLAVSEFQSGNFDSALDRFQALESNPAKVVALYPETVSGRLHVESSRWISLFGGPEKKRPVLKAHDRKASVQERRASIARSPSPSGSMKSILPLRKSTLDAILPASVSAQLDKDREKEKDDDRASIQSRSLGKAKAKSGDSFPRSVESLLQYLSEMRRRINNQVEALKISPSQAHQFPVLSETSVEELFELPSIPLPSLTPEQLTRFAQIVDTALFKAYLIIRPGLLGPLCSLPNWCEVQEIEEVLMEKEKYNELVSLYRGRKMHAKALSLLRKLSEKKSDPEEKIGPSVSYVKNLPEEYIEQVFEAVRWIHQYDSNAAFEIFTAEIQELPRSKVADFLEDELDPALCARYLEYLINERDEMSTLFHDRLAELYLDMASDAKNRRDDDTFRESYRKFINFIETSDIYRVDRLFGLLPSDDMFEARAILLGRMGRHVNALEVYVYRLRDYIKAEEYCKSIYMPKTPTQDIFLSLLKIYLEPSSSSYQKHEQSELHNAALNLIARQSPHLDTLETLRLLPPLVPAQDVRNFLRDAARAPVFDTRVLREVRKARNEQVARRLMQLESHRVRISDSRVCPQCHKRLGTSVIAVHSPRGEVTHYQCREAFANARKRTLEPKPSTRIAMTSRYL